tara:strand:- start:118 stop:348 length:231 start_codon:yes stop_codon:yes gene_type:complete
MSKGFGFLVPAGNVTKPLKVDDKHVARADGSRNPKKVRSQRRALLPVPNTILGRSLARLHTSVTNMVKMHVTYCGG